MQVLGLFSGIGGFELGFRRAGFTIAGVCEIEPYACRVLAKHFPEARLYSDVKELTGERLRQDGIEPYVVTGGFPCQDISLAGKGAGLGGKRSGLWFEMHRVIAETRPRWVVAENVAALRSRGLDQVLGSLAAIGYDAEWHCIPASAVGAPHRRDRIWIVAYPQGDGGHGSLLASERQEISGAVGPSEDVAYPARVQPGRAEQRALGERVGPGGQPQPVADAGSGRRSRPGCGEVQQPGRAETVGTGQTVADADDQGRQQRSGTRSLGARRPEPADSGSLGDPHQPRLEIRLDGHARKLSAAERAGWWLSEPDVGRVAHGIPARVDRLRALGNAVVPQIPEIIADAIAMAELTA